MSRPIKDAPARSDARPYKDCSPQELANAVNGLAGSVDTPGLDDVPGALAEIAARRQCQKGCAVQPCLCRTDVYRPLYDGAVANLFFRICESQDPLAALKAVLPQPDKARRGRRVENEERDRKINLMIADECAHGKTIEKAKDAVADRLVLSPESVKRVRREASIEVKADAALRFFDEAHKVRTAKPIKGR